MPIRRIMAALGWVGGAEGLARLAARRRGGDAGVAARVWRHGGGGRL